MWPTTKDRQGVRGVSRHQDCSYKHSLQKGSPEAWMASSSLTTWLVHCSPVLLSLNLPACRTDVSFSSIDRNWLHRARVPLVVPSPRFRERLALFPDLRSARGSHFGTIDAATVLPLSPPLLSASHRGVRITYRHHTLPPSNCSRSFTSSLP